MSLPCDIIMRMSNSDTPVGGVASPAGQWWARAREKGGNPTQTWGMASLLTGNLKWATPGLRNTYEFYGETLMERHLWGILALMA